jgi:serpin B
MKPVGGTSAHFKDVALIAAVLVGLAGCGDDVNIVPEGPGSDASPTLELRVQRNNDFAFKLYGELVSSPDNLLISPHSIAVTFGMAYAGARGATEREIADVLCFNYPQAGFHSVLKDLNDLLSNRQGLDLRIANGCWGREGEVYLQPFLDTLSVGYGANIEYLDFVNLPEEARAVINAWVEDRTEGLVSDLLPPDAIDALTYLVLANSVYFKADWLSQFDPAYTHTGTFTLVDGSQVSVPLMRGEQTFPYYEGDGYRAVELPYQGEAISMLAVLPDEGRFQEFEASFDVAVLDAIADRLEDTYITITLPKFSFFSEFDLIPTLQAMGMTGAFRSGADFSGMDGTKDGQPWISVVAHKAFISVDEYGTLAAAGTGMVLTKGMHDSFDAERPFIFAIRDIETGTILFLGRVTDPSG